MNHDHNKDNQSVRQTKMRPFLDNRDICHIKIETSTKNKTSKTRHAGRKRNFVAKRPLCKSMSELAANRAKRKTERTITKRGQQKGVARENLEAIDGRQAAEDAFLEPSP